MSSKRVVAVLGYSGRDARRLHPICAGRLEHAHRLAGEEHPVILSGWARHPEGTSEADLMREAWPAPGGRLVCDRTARSTAENAANVAALAGSMSATELVVVTSRWHRRRARILFRAALRSRPVHLSVEGVAGPSPPTVVGRELVCLALVPFQLLRLRRAAWSAEVELSDAAP